MVKYADNLYKGFGHSLSLVICNSVSSVVFEDTNINEAFMMGSFLVLASSVSFAAVAQTGERESRAMCVCCVCRVLVRVCFTDIMALEAES